MTRTSLLFRRIHKWVGLVLGIQFMIWTISGAMMSVLDMETVAGGTDPRAEAVAPLPAGSAAWREVQRSLGSSAVTSVAVRPMLNGHVLEVRTERGARLFDATTGRPVVIDEIMARRIGQAAYVGAGRITRVKLLRKWTLAIREHEPPAWRVDFDDEQNSSFYVSASTGKLLERRNDTWRLWDFFWMLHNMDYVNRTSFNHPLIVFVGFGVVWLAITGLWMLFTTTWRPERRLVDKALR